MNDKGNKSCYIYTRVSTEMQVEGHSLDAQEDRCNNYAKALGIKVKRVFTDKGKTGTSIEVRDEFKRMIEYIKAGERVDYIIVFKLSRFGRNTKDVLNTLEIIKNYNVNLICIEDGIDTSKETGKLLLVILSAVAEMERENINSQSRLAREFIAKKGGWNGAQAPYGYYLKDKKLEIDETAKEHIKLIYDLYLNKNNLRSFYNIYTYIKRLKYTF